MNTETMVEKPTVGEDTGLFQKLIGVFTAPAKTFASIEAKPSWLAPLIIVAAVNLIFVFVAGDIITNETLTQQEEGMMEKGMDSDQIAQALDTTEKVMKYTVPLFSVVGPVVVLLIVAGVFLFVGNVVLGGVSTFKMVFSVTTWSWLILTLYALIVLPLVLAKETMLVNFSLATFLSDESRKTFLYQLLSKIDIFYIWWIVVYGIGLAVIYKMKAQKTVTAVAVVYAIYAVVASALSGLFS